MKICIFIIYISVFILSSCKEQKNIEINNDFRRETIYESGDSIGYYTVKNDTITGPYMKIIPSKNIIEKGTMVKGNIYGNVYYYDLKSKQKKESKTYVTINEENKEIVYLNDKVIYNNDGSIDYENSYCARLYPDVDTIKTNKLTFKINLGKFDSIHFIYRKDTITYYDSEFSYELPNKKYNNDMVLFDVITYFTNKKQRIKKKVKIEKFVYIPPR